MMLEKKFGQRVKERSARAVTELRREVRLLDDCDHGFVPHHTFQRLLWQYGLALEGDDKSLLLEEYDTRRMYPSVMHINLMHFCTIHSGGYFTSELTRS
jgi:hypothetical protein